MTHQINVAVYIYPAADILDFSGPAEIYCAATPLEGPAPFTITSFAHHNPVSTTAGVLTYVPKATFSEVAASIEEYDILVIPGAHPAAIEAMLKSNEGQEVCALLKKFVALKPRPQTGKRILQSVCSGSFILAAAGVLAGRDATTHHMGFDELKKVADGAAGGDSKINVLKTRWVDSGETDAGVGIINAGGVTSGIDSSLYVVEMVAGKEVADWAAEMVEFDRRATGYAE